MSTTSEEQELAELQRLVDMRRKEEGIVVREPKPPTITPLPPRLSSEELDRREQREIDRRNREIAENKRRVWNSLVSDRGSRYQDCQLETFEAETPEQKVALSILTEYCSEIRDNVREGRGVILFGPRGTGKDHLAMAVCRVLIRNDFRVKWQNGMDLFGDIRDLMDEEEASEKTFVDRLIRPDVLYLSDPLPPIGTLTQFQSTMLFRILDGRYSRVKPVICTLNVSGREELDQRIGAQNADRLRHNAIAISCDWESYRQASKRAN